MNLLAQGVQALARQDKAALGDDRPPAGRLAAMVQPEDRANVNPVPAFGFLAAAAQRGAVPPVIAFPEPGWWSSCTQYKRPCKKLRCAPGWVWRPSRGCATLSRSAKIPI